MRLLAAAVFTLASALAAHAQDILLPQPGKPLPQFAVATIKPASVRYIGLLTYPGGRIEGGQCWLTYLISEAFHIPIVRVTGGPDWVKQSRFDITAVPPDDSSARQYTPPGITHPLIDEQRLMLQALLRDRFGLKYHLEKTEQPVYFLERNGKPLKLDTPKHPEWPPRTIVMVYSDGKGNGEIVGQNTTMPYTAQQLSETLQRPVIDQTGITGSYDFHVDAPDEANADQTNAVLEGLPQLGLRLRAGKAPVDTIVIDAVTQPTPN
ncbi:TIGR03435 family protein [Silvibacterium dinghuense]|nr:TIGR03435 family protein [Silvibacterium dinghuense]GGH07363.1 hypothetical protein GCM10011586_24600 [Silvibacterium dinghuense]